MMADEERNKGVEIDHYQPALQSSYGNGLGNTITTQALNRILSTFRPEERYYIYRGLQIDNGKDPNHALKKHLVDRMKQLFSYSSESDIDDQFGQINDLARICLVLVKRGYPATGPLVDAVLIAIFGPLVESVLCSKTRTFKCSKCKKNMSFVFAKNKDVLCVHCGTQVSSEQAKVRERSSRMSSALSLVESIKKELGTSAALGKSRGRVIAIQLVPMDKIRPGIQHRDINFAKVEELRKSIRKHGLLEPIRVRRLTGDDIGFFEIVFGNHRFEACKREGHKAINAEITEDTTHKAAVLNIVENLHRNEEKNYCLLGAWFKRLLTEPGWSMDRIANEIGKSNSYVQRCIGYADVIDPRLHELFSSLIPRGAIYPFSKLSHDQQFTVIEQVKELQAKKGEKLVNWDVLKVVEQVRFPEKVKARQKKWKDEETLGYCVFCKTRIMRQDLQIVTTRLRDGKTKEYVHKNPKDCQYDIQLSMSFDGTASRNKVQTAIDQMKTQMEKLGVRVTENDW